MSSPVLNYIFCSEDEKGASSVVLNEYFGYSCFASVGTATVKCATNLELELHVLVDLQCKKDRLVMLSHSEFVAVLTSNVSKLDQQNKPKVLPHSQHRDIRHHAPQYLYAIQPASTARQLQYAPS